MLVRYKPSPSQPAVLIEGDWLGNLFIPKIHQDPPMSKKLRAVVDHVCQLFPVGLSGKGTRWAVISVTKGIRGAQRPEESHRSGMAVDIAPMLAADNINDGPMKSLRLSERLYMLRALAASAKPDHPAIFAEGDHLHIEASMKSGIVVAYHTYRSAYANDAHVKGKTPIENKAFVVHPDGSTTLFNPVRSRDREGRLIEWPTRRESVRGPLTPKLGHLSPIIGCD